MTVWEAKMSEPKSKAEEKEIKEILENNRVVAVVGLSPKPDRASHQVAQYLQEHGYRIVPVRPKADEILGEKAFASLRDIPFPVEVVDIFRKEDAIPGLWTRPSPSAPRWSGCNWGWPKSSQPRKPGRPVSRW